ncbi:MAG: hypothetical protein KatS3mg091_172 [Patescibacteria group bacterium]|nr:MAG: hypothetical protein KatS3mg091_172 [Patescibacteria group bacterium]
MLTQKLCYCQIEHKKISLKFCEKLEKELKTISSASKTALILALENPHCVCELMQLTELSQTLISHHLSEFQKQGIVYFKQEGRFKRYFLTEKGNNLLAILKEFQNL